MTGDDFVNDLINAMPNPASRMMLIACLKKYAGQKVYLPVESKSERRLNAAANMLNNGMEVSAIISALVERFGISSRTAERDIQNARNIAANHGVTG